MSTRPSSITSGAGQRERFSRLPNSSLMSERRFAYLLALPVAVILVLFNLYPFLYAVWLSIHDVDLRLNIFEFNGLDNYRRALESESVWHSLRLTLYYGFQVTVFSTLLTLGIALLLNEKFVGRTLLMTVMILPWALSTYAAGIVWRFLLSTENGLFSAFLMTIGLTDKRTNLMNADTALTWLAIAHTWHLAPLGVFFMLATLQVIPADLYRVARVDRLNALSRFRYVTFPYLKTPFLIVLILNTLSAVNVFDIIYFTTGGGPGAATRVLTYEIYTQAFLNGRLGYGAAIAWLLLLLVIAITTIYVKALYRSKKASTEEVTA